MSARISVCDIFLQRQFFSRAHQRVIARAVGDLHSTPDAKCGARLLGRFFFCKFYLSALYCQRRSHYALERTTTSYTKAILIIEYIWRTAVWSRGRFYVSDWCLRNRDMAIKFVCARPVCRKSRDNNCDPRRAQKAANVCCRRRWVNVYLMRAGAAELLPKWWKCPETRDRSSALSLAASILVSLWVKGHRGVFRILMLEGNSSICYSTVKFWWCGSYQGRWEIGLLNQWVGRKVVLRSPFEIATSSTSSIMCH